MNFKAQKIQTALFIKGFNVSGYDKYSLVSELKEKVGEIFDDEPVVLPVPPDAPLDIPRIILNSKEKTFTCNIAFNRVDVFRNKPQSDMEKLEDILRSQEVETKKIFDFFKIKKVVVNRIGFVVTFLSETEDVQGSEYLKKEFLLPDKLKDPRELRIIYNKRAENNSIVFNHLLKIIGPKDKKVILEVDVNTIPEIMEKSDFNQENLNGILKYSAQKVINISKEFPNIAI